MKEIMKTTMDIKRLLTTKMMKLMHITPKRTTERNMLSKDKR